MSIVNQWMNSDIVLQLIAINAFPIDDIRNVLTKRYYEQGEPFPSFAHLYDAITEYRVRKLFHVKMDVCGSQSPDYIINEICRIYKHFGPIRSDFVSYNKRVESFRDTNFSNFVISQEDFASAGFYFYMEAEKVSCYYCHLILNDWDITDDVWIEHERFEPACVLVKLNADLIKKNKQIYSDEAKRFISKSFTNDFIEKLKEDYSPSLIRKAILKRFIDGDYNFISVEEGKEYIENYKEYEEVVNLVSSPSDTYSCNVCATNLIEINYHPCGHIYACSMCAPCFSKCPLCQQPIKYLSKVYLP